MEKTIQADLEWSTEETREYHGCDNISPIIDCIDCGDFDIELGCQLHIWIEER
jgi:hypothetical protein